LAQPNSGLPPALTAARGSIAERAGPMSYYVAGSGEPLLLIHSINAAASAYEVKPIFEAMAAGRRVYAPDLPGFGFSDRSKRAYSPRLYTDAILDMLGVIAADGHGDAAMDVLALSLSAEFLARAANERPESFRTLTFVTPTGFQKGSEKLRGPDGGTREIPGLYRFFTFPVWSQGIYSLLVSKPSIRFFLRKTFGSDNYPEGLADYDYLTAHQPGAKNAPFAFVSGKLFSADTRTLYERLTLPVWMPHATKGDFQDFREAGWTRHRANWHVQAFDTGALPHFEQPGLFMQSFERFLEKAGAA
jgi:pimeloyl-ACP methyl ester carboxylesterase